MDIKVRDLKQTEKIENDDKLMVLVDDNLNLVKNITKEEFITNVISKTENNALVQETDGNLYVNTSELATRITELDSKFSNEIGNLDELTTEAKNNLVSAINEAAHSGGGGSATGGYNLFDLIKTDHILEGDEAVGKEMLGTYVYKTGISGTRYGYPDFVNKCIEEMKAGEDYLIVGNNITLPTFTANTTNGITISDARGNKTTLRTLFNNGLTRTAGSYKIGSWSTYWINIDYGKPTYLKNYKIASDNKTSPEYPSAWTIQGSNDGVNFDILGSYSGETFPLNAYITFNEGVSYYQTKPYSQYRLVFSAGVENSGNGELGWVTFDAQDAAGGKKNPNGHIFYNIADKDIVDAIYESTGKAYFFGVDEENERIFLPRIDAVSFTPKDKLKVYGDGNGLAFYTGETGCNYLTTNNSYNSSKPLYLSNKTSQLEQLGSTSITQNTAHGGSYKAYGVLTKEQSTSRKASTGLTTDNFKQDDTFYYYMVVGSTSKVTHVSTTVPEGEALNQIYQNKDDILNKLNLDGSNAQFPIISDIYINGSSGYIILANKICIQWGTTTVHASSVEIPLLIEFANTDFFTMCGLIDASTSSKYCPNAYPTSTTKITIYSNTSGAINSDKSWCAIGLVL